MGTDEAEGLELLGLALDGPRTGPIGEAIVHTPWEDGGPVSPSGDRTFTRNSLGGKRRTNLPRRCNSRSAGTAISWPLHPVLPRFSEGTLRLGSG